MTIKPITKPRVRRTFQVYDLEWIPGTLELRLIGTHDGTEYKHYTRVDDFLNDKLTGETNGTWFYAHAGGLYDFQFLLDELASNPLYQVEASFSGSSAIVVRVSAGNLEWFFIDSYWLLRDKLADLLPIVGMKKGECSWDAPLSELIAYNYIDCYGLWKVIEFFEEMLWMLGGQLERTIASCAMSLFRRQYLHRTIRTSGRINRLARAAYIGSRVEVFEHECLEGQDYDINSSFSYAMLDKAPCNMFGEPSNTLPKAGIHYLAEATIESFGKVPPLPYRTADDRIYFPTGKWRGWFVKRDIELAEQYGRVHEIHKVITFDSFTDLGDYAQDVYEKRASSVEAGLRLVLKYLLNALYGKFGERPEKEKLLVNPTSKELAKYPRECRRLVAPGIYLVDVSIPVPHEHVIISAHITAVARANLFEYLRKCISLFNCDTDGFVCGPRAEQTFPTGTKLGELKLAREVKPVYDDKRGKMVGAIFPAPKLYAMHTNKGFEIKAKGFSRLKNPIWSRDWTEQNNESRPINYQDFCDLLEHKELPIETFSRVRSTVKNERLLPLAGVMQKTWRGTTRPKRCALPDGSTRPWEIDELTSRNH